MRRETLRRLLLLLTSLLVSGLAAEAGFRAYERRYLAGDERALQGNVVDLAALNLNDSAVTRAKPAGEFRVLGFGDSFAYGIVQYPYTYHHRAAEVLEAAVRGQVRMVDLGEPAVSFVQYGNALRRWEKALDHDGLVFMVYLGNDVLDVAYKYVPDDRGPGSVFRDMPFSIQTGRGRLGAVPRRYGLRTLDYAYAFWRMRTAVEPAVVDDPRYNRAVLLLTDAEFLDNQRTQLDNFDPARLPALGEGYRAAAGFLREVAQRRERGTKVAVVLAPNQTQVDAALRAKLPEASGARLDYALPAQVIARLAEAIDGQLPVIDLRASLRCASQEGQKIHYRTDTHWSVEGNRLVGEVLGRQLARHWFPAAALDAASLQACARVDPEARPSLRPANEAAVQAFVQEILEAPYSRR